MIISRGLNPFFLFLAIALFFSQVVSCSSREKPKNPVVPFPAKISFEQGRLEVGSEFRVILKGYVEPRLERAVRRMIHRLSAQTGIPLSSDIGEDDSKAVLEITCRGDPTQSGWYGRGKVECPPLASLRRSGFSSGVQELAETS